MPFNLFSFSFFPARAPDPRSLFRPLSRRRPIENTHVAGDEVAQGEWKLQLFRETAGSTTTRGGSRISDTARLALFPPIVADINDFDDARMTGVMKDRRGEERRSEPGM